MSDSREGFFPYKTPDTEKEERDSEEGRLGIHAKPANLCE